MEFTKSSIMRHYRSAHYWKAMEALYNRFVRGWNHYQCISKAPELELGPRTNDLESKASVVMLVGQVSVVCWTLPHGDVSKFNWFARPHGDDLPRWTATERWLIYGLRVYAAISSVDYLWQTWKNYLVHPWIFNDELTTGNVWWLIS